MSENTSVLRKYTRTPKLFIDLPSHGKHYPEGALDKHEELEVYSMTASDEIITRTPDALLNGEATVRIIQNCIPAIKNAWAIPVTDIYTILTAIRMASYGSNFEVKGQCPECKEENTYGVNLQNIIDTFRNKKFVDYIKEDTFEFYLRPQNYEDFTKINREMFVLQRQIVQHIPEIKDQEEKDKETQKIYDQMTRIRVEAVLRTVVRIDVDGESEDNWDEIVAFVSTNDKKYYNRLEEVAIQNNGAFVIPPTDVECSNCSKTYKIPIEMDYSNFFATS